MANLRTAHTTEDEKNFIRGLGSYSELKRDRYELLRKYIAAMQKRTEFGIIDRLEVIGFAVEQAKQEVAK